MELLEMARELGLALQQDEIYIKFRIADQNVECDEDLQVEIKEFNEKKSEINFEISKEKIDHEKLDSLNKRIGELYSKVNSNEKTLQLNIAKNEFETLLRNINTIIMKSAEGIDPNAIDLNDFSTSCSGDCGGCGGCH